MCGQSGYIAPAVQGVPSAGEEIRRGYLTPAILGIPNAGDTIKLAT